jgi:hypothetical protein
MAFKRIVANSEEDLKTIMSNIKTWFKETNDYKTEFTTEKRKFQDPDTKAIVEKTLMLSKQLIMLMINFQLLNLFL